jgi:TonB family protein
MLRPNLLLVHLIVLPASFLYSQAGIFQGPETVLHYPPSAAVETNPGALALELDRAIVVLERGLTENWGTGAQYLSAFEKTLSTDSAGGPVTDAKKYVECAMGVHLRIHQIWDEGPPLGVEVHRTIIDFTELRNEAEQAKTAKAPSSNAEGQAAGLRPTPCAVPASRKVAISAGVAGGMLSTKVEPLYPTEALKAHISGTVVLHATISIEGGVEALGVMSGPASLQQAALDAVRQWRYRPYLLNNVPVEVETTINVVFAPRR